MRRSNQECNTLELEQLPPWLVAIRSAVAGAIKSTDIQAIFEKQVELAKNGDRRAAKFVFEQARAFSDLRGLTLIQNVYHGERPDERTEALPGTDAKLERMQRRVAAGLPTCRKGDGILDGEE